MDGYKTDVPVALVFFNRPDTLKEVFESIRRARPSKLFLIQDGAREGNEKDRINIPKCRAIVEDVDWDCEVHKIYSDENLGCGYRIYSGVSEAFKHVDRLVIIEDDIVIGEDMLPFCAEMLERYKDDQRIDKISGMNHVIEYKECPYSYFSQKEEAQYGDGLHGSEYGITSNGIGIATMMNIQCELYHI